MHSFVETDVSIIAFVLGGRLSSNSQVQCVTRGDLAPGKAAVGDDISQAHSDEGTSIHLHGGPSKVLLEQGQGASWTHCRMSRVRNKPTIWGFCYLGLVASVEPLTTDS